MITGMFGKKKKHPYIDDVLMPGGGIGGGLPDYMGGAPKGKGNLPEQTMMGQKRPSFFGQGGTGRAIAGTLSDFLLQQADMRPIYGPAMQQRQFLQAQQQRDQAKRFAEQQDWRMKEDYKRDNPTQTAAQKNTDWYANATDEQRRAFGEVYDIMTPKFVTGADQRPYQIPRNRPPIGARVKDPRKGGPSQPAAGNFRR